MAKYLLDSDVCIGAMGKRAESLMPMIEEIRADGLAISVINYGEVTEGVLFSRQRALNLQRWHDFLEPLDIIGITLRTAEIWAELRGSLRAAGMTTPDNDLLIASTALQFDLTIVTLNKRHFGRVDGLSMLVPQIVTSD
jgi:tRNA(fMet)-specific endonuclease VapC